MTVRRGMVLTIVGLVACSVLMLTACSGSTDSDASEYPAAPVVVHLDHLDGRPTHALSEAEYLAHRVLARDHESLLIDAEERDRMADEIAWILSRIREAHPEVADVPGHPYRHYYLPEELYLELEPGLYEAILSVLENQTGPVLLRTGNAAFDALNQLLGVSVVSTGSLSSEDPYYGAITFYGSEYLNPWAALEAYREIEGVESALLYEHFGDALLAIPSDIFLSRSEGVWSLVFQRPVGCCTNGERFYFTVDGTSIEFEGCRPFRDSDDTFGIGRRCKSEQSNGSGSTP